MLLFKFIYVKIIDIFGDIMKDTSFIDLTKDESIKKMVIDERLMPAFKIVMKNFQKYFNDMGYTNSRDYKTFFEQHLLHPYCKFLIRCNKRPSLISEGCNGFVDFENQEIVIDESLLGSQTNVIDTLTHEFIHFLIHINNHKENDIIYYPPIDEAMTEMLTLKILPMTDQSYFYQIEMLKIWYLLNDKEINFKDFLNKGKMPHMEFIFKSMFCDYHIESENKGLYGEDNILYVKMQRFLLNNYDINIKTLEEYKKLVYKLANRPVKDIYFMNKYYKNMERNLAYNLNITDKNIYDRFMLFIKEYRKILEYLSNKKTKKYIITFKFLENEYEIDDRKNVYLNNLFLGKNNSFTIDDDLVFNIEYSKIKQWKSNKLKYLHKLTIKKERLEEILKYIIFISDNEIIESNFEKCKKCQDI